MDREWDELKRDADRKRHLVREVGWICQVDGCGVSQWLGKPAPIQLDHIDGNPDNNSRSNLRLICAMCHAQTTTYSGKNVGKFPNSTRAQKMRSRRGPVR